MKRDVPPLEITSNKEMLWHVFSNLVQNAVNFRGAQYPEIRIAARSEGGEVEVRVADNGRGMQPEELEKAFSRFYQSTASTEGSGVGLTICRRITRDLGGQNLAGIGREGQGGDGSRCLSFPNGRS